MPSRNEAMPMVVIEAMAAGTAVIAPAVGAVPDMLGHGSCGTLVTMPFVADSSRPSSAQVDAWREALASLLDAPAPALARRIGAWRRQREHYSVTAMVDGYERAIAAALRGPAMRPARIRPDNAAPWPTSVPSATWPEAWRRCLRAYAAMRLGRAGARRSSSTYAPDAALWSLVPSLRAARRRLLRRSARRPDVVHVHLSLPRVVRP